jgi:hypothetical protein
MLAGPRVRRDDRLGRTRWIVSADNNMLMQISSEFLECVVFVHCEMGGIRRPAGTAFFVSLPAEQNGNSFRYLVTAKHVIDGVRAHSSDRIVHLRVNVRGGGFDWVDSAVDDWVTLEGDEYIDVAVLPWLNTSALVVDHQSIPAWAFLDNATLPKVHKVGLGDELFMTGLFVSHHGRKRNIPIVRFGNIAAMPDEPVHTSEGNMSAYLAEARSLGGLSGSPAFVVIGPLRVDDKGEADIYRRSIRLLGLVRGHWDAELTEEEADTLIDSHLDGRRELVNMGIAIIVPVDKILEVLNQPMPEENRRAQEEEFASEGLPTADVSAPKEPPPLTREGFFRSLRRIKKEPPPPSQSAEEAD